MDRWEHQQEVLRYLQKNFSAHDWRLSLPPGSGMETYFAQDDRHMYFVKAGAPVERYRVMAEAGLTPPVISLGKLESGHPILVQEFIPGRSPSPGDFQEQLEKVALLVRQMHADPRIRNVLPPASSNRHRDAGLQALHLLWQRWKCYRAEVREAAAFVDQSLQDLARQIHHFSGGGLAASHNDICNANWLLSSDGRIYILDLESMSRDDPAMDMGALLWWYYPPELRKGFLEIAGYRYDEAFKHRMRIRMAMHCLSITLPREHSFDEIQADRFYEFLNDFRAVLDGKENPQGY